MMSTLLFVCCSGWTGRGRRVVECQHVKTLLHQHVKSLRCVKSTVSHDPYPGNTGITHLSMNVGGRGTQVEGGYQQDLTVGWANIELRMKKR